MVQNNPSVREFQRGDLPFNEALWALPAHSSKLDSAYPEFQVKGMYQREAPGISHLGLCQNSLQQKKPLSLTKFLTFPNENLPNAPTDNCWKTEHCFTEHYSQ